MRRPSSSERTVVKILLAGDVEKLKRKIQSNPQRVQEVALHYLDDLEEENRNPAVVELLVATFPVCKVVHTIMVWSDRRDKGALKELRDLLEKDRSTVLQAFEWLMTNDVFLLTDDELIDLVKEFPEFKENIIYLAVAAQLNIVDETYRTLSDESSFVYGYMRATHGSFIRLINWLNKRGVSYITSKHERDRLFG